LIDTLSVWLKTALFVDPAADFQLFQSSAAESRDQEYDQPHLPLCNINPATFLYNIIFRQTKTNLTL